MKTSRVVGCFVAALGFLSAAGVSAQTSRPRPSFVVEILSGSSLKPDGSGLYRDRERGVVASGNVAVVLCTDDRTCTTLPEGEPATPAQRALLLDLGSPVVASGAKDRGTVKATAANFGAFWEQDISQRTVVNGREGPVIRSVLDLAVGRTIESDRVEIRFFMNGAQHILQFGPWTAGQYQTKQGVYHGDGTTRGSITRVSETKWVVRSGLQSIGRLWNNSDAAHPVDLGLYRFSYESRFDTK